MGRSVLNQNSSSHHLREPRGQALLHGLWHNACHCERVLTALCAPVAGSVKFSKEAPLGAAAPQAPRTDAAGGAGSGSGLGQGRGARAPVMWGGARSAAARDMLAGLGLAGSGLSLPGAWGPGLDLGRLAGFGAEVRLGAGLGLGLGFCPAGFRPCPRGWLPVSACLLVAHVCPINSMQGAMGAQALQLSDQCSWLDKRDRFFAEHVGSTAIVGEL